MLNRKKKLILVGTALALLFSSLAAAYAYTSMTATAQVTVTDANPIFANADITNGNCTISTNGQTVTCSTSIQAGQSGSIYLQLDDPAGNPSVSLTGTATSSNSTILQAGPFPSTTIASGSNAGITISFTALAVGTATLTVSILP